LDSSVYYSKQFLAQSDKLLTISKAVQERLKEQIKGVDVAQSKEVHLFWYGVAEVGDEESMFFFNHVV
jgi:hypothetical protein